MSIDGAPRCVALINLESDIIDAYLTDGLLNKYDLVVLEGDKGFFLLYHAISIVNNQVLEEFLEVVLILDELSTY